MFNLEYFFKILPIILVNGLRVTISLTLIVTICSLIIGLIVAIITYYRIKPLNYLCSLYVSIFRGTPLLPQIFFIYFGLAYFSETVRAMSPFTATGIVMSLNIGAYMSETIRASFLSVDEGQKEAAYSLGMSNLQLMQRIIVPQAVRVAIPTLFNNIVDIIKATSVAFVVGVPDIMGVAKTEGAMSFRYFEIYAAIMLIYWIIITLFTFIQKNLEYKLERLY